MIYLFLLLLQVRLTEGEFDEEYNPTIGFISPSLFCDELILADATSPLEVHELVSKSTQGKLADLVVNLTNVAQVEMSCILCSKPGGIVYFFSMATSFSQAALGAEGISSDSHLVIGNGFVPGAADYTLNLIRRQDRLRQHLVNFYSHQTG